MRRHLSSLVCLFALLAPAGNAAAFGWDDVDFEIHGDYRFRTEYEGEVIVFKTPPDASIQIEQQFDAGFTGEQRIRFEPKAVLFEQVTLALQIDVLNGLVFSDTGDRTFLEFSDLPPPDLDGVNICSFNVNRAWGEWKAPFGVIRVGRQPSEWGLGMISNSGDGYDVPFGDKYLGDTSDRVAAGTKPISLVRALVTGEKPDTEKDPLTVAFAYDWHVVRDTYYKPGDQADQYAVLVLLEREGNKAGFYAVRRHQEHNDTLVSKDKQPPDGEFLEAWVLDTTGRLAMSPEMLEGTELRFEWELAYVTGRTNLTVPLAQQDPRTGQFPVMNVHQLGWVLRLGAKRTWADLQLEGGYASGDGNRVSDGEVNDFRFHPDYNVGLILFDDLLASMTAAQTYNLVNQQGEGGPEPPLGANYLVTNGSVTNAVYAFPTLRVTPVENVQGIIGVLWAQAAQPMIDQFNDCFLGSGCAGEVNSLGGDASKKDLGWEIDLGASYTIPTGFYESKVILGIEYGHLFVGNAFEDGDGVRIPDIDKVRLKLTATW